MKRLLFLSVLLMSLAICGTAFADGPEHGKVFTFTGVITKDTSQTDFDRKTFGQLYAIDNEWWPSFFEKDLQNVSQEFRQCIDDLKYQGIVDITAKVESDNRAGAISLVFDKSSTCKRH